MERARETKIKRKTAHFCRHVNNRPLFKVSIFNYLIANNYGPGEVFKQREINVGGGRGGAGHSESCLKFLETKYCETNIETM